MRQIRMRIAMIIYALALRVMPGQQRYCHFALIAFAEEKLREIDAQGLDRNEIARKLLDGWP